MLLSKLTPDVMDRLYNAGHPMMMTGGPGCGKTSVITQYAESRDMACVPFPATSLDAPDAQGHAIPVKGEPPRSVYTQPTWLSRIMATGKERGILFLDEFAQAEHIVAKALAPLLSEGHIGEWKLPKGWVVWLASNRIKDKAGVNKMLSHVINRMTVVNVEPDVQGWKKWANMNGVHPMYIAFAEARPDVIFHDNPIKDPNAPRCTPRSFTFASDFHKIGSEGMDLRTDEVSLEFVQGFIGEGAAGELMAYAKVNELLPTYEEILKDHNNAPLPPAERIDAHYAAAQMCVHYVDHTNVDQMFGYALRIRKELQVATAKQMIDKTRGALLNSPIMRDFIKDNPTLISGTLS